MVKHHILGLDMLRGICALSVAAYHVFNWSQYITFSAVGFYCVYIFFVLSGFSIHYQYRDKIEKLEDIRIFLQKRFFRLFPLLALIIAIQYLPNFFTLDRFGIATVSLTASLLFGFSVPGATSAVIGGWSLGIEFSFYMFYPIILSYCKSLRQFIALITIFFLLRLLFIEYVFHPNYAHYWMMMFTTPLSFVFYFVAGCFIAEIYPRLQSFLNKKYILFLLFPLFFLFFMPINLAEKSVLVGFLGTMLAFFSCCVVLIYSLYMPKSIIAKKVCSFLGDISYGVYLLHPLVWKGFIKLNLLNNFPALQCLLILTITSAIAFFIKKVYEDPIIKKLKNSYCQTG